MVELSPNTSLQGGKYIIKRVLGQGGFGITYLAEQISLGREVAIKEFFMKDNCVRDDETGSVTVPTTGSAAQVEQYRKKFLKEARMLAGFIHPNIINVIDVFEENGTVYYSMPYYAGGSLKDLVSSNGKLQEGEAMKYVKKIASALKYMHQDKHVCHFDVKPDNILFDINGNPALIDFGISKNYDDRGNETSSTPVGMSEGYAPIEQYQQMVEEFSPGSDVYALGATLYFMVTGTKPPTAVSRVGGEELFFNSETSSSLRELIESAMTIGVKKRPGEVDMFLNYEVREPLETTIVSQDNPKSPKIESIKDETVVASKSEKSFTVNGVSFTMIRVEGGTFVMGRQGWFVGDEGPAHHVKLSNYYIGKYPVTQELWQAVIGSNPSKFQGNPSHPVEQVSWEDCQEFIRKLNALSGKCFRLPTEAEWEFAARGGNKTNNYKFSGSDILDDVAWSVDYRMTQPVGKKMPNELGLYDMSGNVQEWCYDWYGEYSSEYQHNPCGPNIGKHRIMRGGGYYNAFYKFRVTARDHCSPTSRFSGVGLRLVLTD